MASTRPAPELPATPLFTVVRWAGPVGSVIVTIVVLATYPSLPDRVPTHFTGAMEADSYGPRWSVLALGAVFVALSGAMGWLADKPHRFNYPTPVTPDNAQAVYRAGAMMMGGLGCAMPILYAGLVLAVHGLPGLPLMIAGLAVLGGALVVGIWRIGRVSRIETVYHYGRERDR
ncbi:DUF1648 domain-containing protein [Gordonia humi]|uniref:DUF1648 domain-containing protein n=1 Tax=Gordonia humi TaxID=686429 RepID=A0A840F9D0_9ACTN|nr:DUF1648 domain-containing protein [Gordonia humi]MBB4136127.1 hypothetical protein [Gordonia humi]